MVRAATILRQLRISMPSGLPSIPSLPPKPTFAPSTSASSSTIPRAKPIPVTLPAIPGLPPKPVALALSPVRVSRRRSPSPETYSRRSISPPSHRRRSPSPLPLRRRSPSPLARRRSPSPPLRRRSPLRRSPSPYARRRSPEPRRRSPPRYRVRSPSPRPSSRYREPSLSRTAPSYSASKPSLASRNVTASYSTTAERVERGRTPERSPSVTPLAPRKRQRSTPPPSANKKAATEPQLTVTTAPLVPTGPRADRIPTGPRADMPSRGRGRGGAKAASRVVFTPLSPPIHNLTHIKQVHGDGGKLVLKPQWDENPKAPLANYAGGQSGGATNFGENGSAYQVSEGTVNGQKMFRVKVIADQAAGIVGIGDHAVRKEAEKLAAYSACLQLVQAGKLDNRKGAKQPAGPKEIHISSNSPSDTAKLSDGSLITYDRARQFMEYYCQRFGFGKPDVMFESSSVKTRKSGPMVQQWEAVITVGGRRIGQGAGASKKTAQVKCYLDVTQYLESCDPDLWRNFIEASKKDTSGNIGQAPHILFQMSDDLTDEIGDLCRDVKSSTLYARRPPTGSSNVELEPEAQHRRVATQPASPEYIVTKSAALQDKLAAYQNDESLAAMRAQRETLPIFSKANGILAKIEVNDVTIVMAATGSGKTTQVPQLLFDDWINRGEGAKCNIICTQPRRLAATSVAERVAEERGDVLGNEVGYQVRFDVKLPQPHGSITFCTTGIFLKRMQSALGAGAHSSARDAMDLVTHIVVDEVHERDIDTDLLLVVLKRLLADRKARGIPLKIILMSATVDPTLFQSYFADSKGRLAPIAEVPGRTFPVERHHLEDIVEDMRGNGLPNNRGGWVFSEKDVNNYLQKELSGDPAAFAPGSGGELPVPYALVALTIAHVLKQSDDGHVLVFLPGWDEIKKVSAFLLDDPRKFPLFDLNLADTSKFSVHYLHSTIPAAEQREVFRPPPKGVRRIILATNIAETSVTIPDVVYVVDTARVKEKQYDPDRHMSSLVTAWVGSSNLNQRAGRAGRHRPGEYYGLLSRQRQSSLRAHQLVEMKRSDLSNVVMHVKALNLGVVEEVLAATIEPPEESRVVAAMNVLRMLGALDEAKNLTSLGKVLLQLPVEAAIGKLCLYGSFFRCLDSALTLASVLTNRDPFMAPVALKAQADAIKDSWSPASFRSDPLAVVAAYNEWHSMQSRGEYRPANNFLSDNFLNKSSMLQIEQIKSSLLQSLDQAGVLAVSAGGGVQTSRFGRNATVPPELNTNGQSLPLLAALIAMASAPNFALRTSEKTCRTSQDKTVNIHASSVNSRRRETGGPEAPAAAFNPAEKRLYAFAEKQRNVPAGGNPNAGQTQLRSVTRLDPMTYMLFGAYHLRVTQRGLECDDWLPIVGNLDALDNIQRLKTLLDACMLRVFEGVGKTIGRNRDRRYQATRNAVEVHQGTSMLRSNSAMDDGEGENESEDDEDTDLIGGTGKPRPTSRNWDPTLSDTEVKELDLLTADVVGVLDRYAEERDSSVSRRSSRPATPSYGGNGFGLAQRGPPTGPRNGGFGNGASFSTNSGQGAYANLSHGANSYRPPIPGNVPTGPKAGRPSDWRSRKQLPTGPSTSQPSSSQAENLDTGGW